MPLSPYQYRPVTPPSAELPGLISGSKHARHESGSSLWSNASSPDSLDLHVTTPPDRSPVRQQGPLLLPKIRTQDQLYDITIPGSTSKAPKSHRRVISNHYIPQQAVRPAPYRSSTSPPESDLISPISAVSATSQFPLFSPGGSSEYNSAVNSPITLTASYQRRLGHSRSVSAPSIDNATTLGRFAYPTYRQTPSYVTSNASNYWTPSATSGSTAYVHPLATFSHPVESPINLNEELTALNEYLRAPNPAVDLVQCVRNSNNPSKPYAWWDIRNVRSWKGFNLEAIMATPSFPALLSVPVSKEILPTPVISQRRLYPSSEAALCEVIRDFYISKVNAALRVGQGQRHLAIHVGKGGNEPSFFANYQDDVQRTILGNGQGRVVGLVLSHEQWNTGLRTEAGQKKVNYLEGLARLHCMMRVHQCRYGFIMTETELVCARAGTDDTPYFGLLELTPAIETRVEDGLTACLALWYLHMLAKDEPLRGQPGWRLNIGAPAALTRKRVMESKDSWIPEPKQQETRRAKSARGWILPSDAWSRKREHVKVWT